MILSKLDTVNLALTNWRTDPAGTGAGVFSAVVGDGSGGDVSRSVGEVTGTGGRVVGAGEMVGDAEGAGETLGMGVMVGDKDGAAEMVGAADTVGAKVGGSVSGQVISSNFPLGIG